MISKMEVHQLVIKPLDLLYRSRWEKEKSPIEYGELVDLLVGTIYDRGYTAQSLEAGMEILRSEWIYNRWPVAAELVAFLDRGREKVSPKKLTVQVELDPEEWADRIMRGDWGQQAISRNIAGDLHNWLYRHSGEFPSMDLLDELVEDVGRARHVADKIKAANPYGVYSLYEAMQARNRRITAKYAQHQDTA